MLTIIVEHSGKYKEAIDQLCKKSGIISYKILDPLCHTIPKKIKHVLFCGNVPVPGLEALKIWQTQVPDSKLDKESKMKIFSIFKEAGTWLQLNSTNQIAKKGDIPPLKTLKEFFDSLNGEIVEILLDDNRLMGIYPDGEPLKMKYDIEYHASIILNLARLNDLFEVKKIMIKEN